MNNTLEFNEIFKSENKGTYNYNKKNLKQFYYRIKKILKLTIDPFQFSKALWRLNNIRFFLALLSSKIIEDYSPMV